MQYSTWLHFRWLNEIGLAFCLQFGVMACFNVCWTTNSCADEPTNVDVWSDLAPGETSRDAGTLMPRREGEIKPIDRVSGVRRPTLEVYVAKNNPSGTAVIILPGGGFSYVVPNLEGSEAAEWLNEIGVTAFVLRYRTNEAIAPGEAAWKRPLQDAQRAIRVVRQGAANWKLDPDRVGVLGFSAGGQVATILHASTQAAYPSSDETDKQRFAPDFSLLIYPWRVIHERDELLEPIKFTDKAAPAFIVHTHDDASSSIGAAKVYIELKKLNVSAELHVYQNGGHGYGVRERPNSVISTWPSRATEWFKIRGLLDPQK